MPIFMWRRRLMPTVGCSASSSSRPIRVGFEELLGWLAGFGEVIRVGVEGTGSCGVELARFLHYLTIEVVEVDRPNRQVGRKKGKSDPTDAVAAAWVALSGQASVIPKTRNGPIEQMRVLLVARRSARQQRIQTLNQLRQLVFLHRRRSGSGSRIRDLPAITFRIEVAA